MTRVRKATPNGRVTISMPGFHPIRARRALRAAVKLNTPEGIAALTAAVRARGGRVTTRPAS